MPARARAKAKSRAKVPAGPKRRSSRTPRKVTPPAAQAKSSGWRRWALLLTVGVLGWLALEYALLPEVGFLREKNPGTTALMEQRAQEAQAEGRKVRRRQHWVALARINPVAVDAVLLSEDAAFFAHSGVDTRELRLALREAWEHGELGRGASTLTMQLAKNLWLSEDRSLLRKLKEVALTYRLEAALSKKRILTLYLNVAEWGDGVYGIEAAAREHFGRAASELSGAQAIVLATMLPAPRTWLPTRRSKRHHGRALRLLERLTEAGKLSSEDAAETRAELERLFAGGEDDN